VVNNCHLMSYYFLELLPIFVILNTSVLFPHLIQQSIKKLEQSYFYFLNHWK